MTPGVSLHSDDMPAAGSCSGPRPAGMHQETCFRCNTVCSGLDNVYYGLRHSLGMSHGGPPGDLPGPPRDRVACLVPVTSGATFRRSPNNPSSHLLAECAKEQGEVQQAIIQQRIRTQVHHALHAASGHNGDASYDVSMACVVRPET
jgi:hypothetical protein